MAENPERQRPSPQELAARAEATQRRLVAVDRHLAGLEQDLAELQQALATLAGLQGRDATPGLLPIGGGVRLHARIDPAAAIMVDLGAGYATETDLDGAMTRIQARLEATQSAYRAADNEATRLSQSFHDLRAQLAAQAPD